MYRNDVSFGNVGYGYDEFPSETYYHEQVGLLGSNGSNYLGDSLKYSGASPSPNFEDVALQRTGAFPLKADPYLPIMNEPMGYGYAEKNFESSLDTVGNYRYQPAPRDEEKYYPASMLNDSRVDMQYERFTSPISGFGSGFATTTSLDNSPVQLLTKGPKAWWMPSYMEVGIFMILIILVLLVKCMALGQRVDKLEKKKSKLEAEANMQKVMQSAQVQYKV